MVKLNCLKLFMGDKTLNDRRNLEEQSIGNVDVKKLIKGASFLTDEYDRGDLTGYEKEWNQVYNIDKDPIRKYIIFPVLKEKMGDLNNSRILDAGCGNGSLINMLRDKRFSQAYGIDLSNDFLQFAQKNIEDKRVNFKKANLLEKFPFEDNYFDDISSVFVLNELQTLDETFREFHRVLKIDGNVHIIMTHPFFAAFYQLYEKFTGKQNEKLIGLVNYFDKSELKYNFTIAAASARFYQHTFEEIICSAAKNNLAIKDCIELATNKEEFREYPKYWGNRDVPMYLYIKLIKQK